MLIANILLAALTFVSPVKFDVSLAGNFGEPRPHHFHGGLDIKTQREEGKPIHAVGDGYVCRVTVSSTGYGNAVYVRHPDGHTTVYAHLQRFAPAIEAKVKKWQYEHHSWAADVPFRATDCPVSQGQVIALSGNTGSSMGPHLHLEFHQTDTWDLYDPLEFIPSLLQDKKAPEVHGVMAYPVAGRGVFCGKVSKTKISPSASDSSRLEAWGEVGFAINADDYMDGSPNYYGIRRTVLYVDDQEVFRSDVNGIPVNCNRMVNSWGDYDEYRKEKHWYMKSFVEPGNTLPVLHADANRGIVHFNQERDYHIRYELCDFFGNAVTYRFVVKGHRMDIPPRKLAEGERLLRLDETAYEQPALKLSLPPGALADDVVISPRDSTGTYAKAYRLARKSVPLLRQAQLSMQVSRQVDDVNKLFIAADGRSIGGEYHDGWMVANILDIGQMFTVDYDDTPPRVERLGDAREGVLAFQIEDEATGVAVVEASIDGQFVLFAPVGHTTRYTCSLKNTPVRPTGQIRTLTLQARDNRGNQSVYTATIKY